MNYKKLLSFGILDVDAMFYHSSVNNFRIAQENYFTAKQMNDELQALSWYREYQMWNWGDEIDVDFSDVDLSEEDIGRVKDIEEKAKLAFSVFLQAAAAVHVFCVISLEAHINKRAKELLSGSMYEQFEKTTIEGKWVFFPKLMGLPGFDAGTQPFQDFSQLVSYRNSLVHYKSKRVLYESNSTTSLKVYEKLGLSPEQAEMSLHATKEMITGLAQMLAETAPQWLEDTKADYFRLETVLEDV